MTDPRDTESDSTAPRADAAPVDRTGEDATGKSGGALDKIKNAVGHAIGSEGKRHGARDTDPGS